jgi:hypothetical protein
MARQKASRHYHKNAELSRAKSRAKYAADPDRYIQRVVMRSKRIRHLTPPWADLRAIASIYADARRITRETGIEHHVDHIIPLGGREVTGLHVETNLRIVTRAENQRKWNRFVPELLTDNNA